MALAAGCNDHPPGTTTRFNADVYSPSARDTGSLTGTSIAATQLLRELENAYRDSSDEEFAAFFRRWHETVPPIDEDDVFRPLERELYALYLAFFARST